PVQSSALATGPSLAPFPAASPVVHHTHASQIRCSRIRTTSRREAALSPTYRPFPALVLISGTILLLGCDSDRATAPETVDRPALATGLPANPSTKEDKFNLIGVPRDKTPTMTGDQGKRMFVKLWGKSTINLQEGPFDILDANATDNNGGLFQLPDPDPDDDGVTSYGVWVRTLGTPHRSAKF